MPLIINNFDKMYFDLNEKNVFYSVGSKNYNFEPS
jgi:hypothetical protein